MTARDLNVFTVPSGQPFLRALARAVLDGNLPHVGGKPPTELELASYTILLPTRRAARSLQDAFLAVTGGKALLLPSIRPIAEGDEDLSLITSLSGPVALTPGDADIPPAVREIERRLVLTGLVQRWSEAMRGRAGEAADDAEAALAVAAGAGTAAQAAALAAELARLMDEVETEGVTLDNLGTLVPETYSEHWQKTLQFLDIVLTFWPLHLQEHKLLSPMDRRNRLVRAEARRLAAVGAGAPVIVAGVTGSIPATAELMRVVAGLPRGALVLPGLDLSLDDESWDAISTLKRAPPPPGGEGLGLGGSRDAEKSPDPHPEHPHFGMKRLLDALGLPRSAVRELPGAPLTENACTRARLVSEAMRPAATTERWHAFTETADRDAIRQALAGVTLIEAPTTEDEAEVVALILRHAAETPGQTAALVSRDRLLARRVAVRLEAWGIRVDDSAGRPLAKTIPGAFLDLMLSAVATGFAPAAVMAMLKHPLTRLGLPAFTVRRAARALEVAVFRTLYLGRGIDDIADALARAETDVGTPKRRGRAVERLWKEDWQAAADLVERMRAAYAPLVALFERNERIPLRNLARAHVSAAEALAAMPEGDTARGLWAEVAGETAALFFAGLVEEDLPDLSLTPAEYPDLYRSLVSRETVRLRVPLHPRLAIWGPLEARLQQPDIVILGSLNEGTWPEQVDPGPWLNRPMRATLGLPSPEEKIGYAAHDFTMLMGASCVYLTRAEKIDGVPAVPSRWLLRLEALLSALKLEDAVAPSKNEPWLAWAAHRNHTPPMQPVKPPAPKPPLELRPRRMSVSAVETLVANPYAIFARLILGLDPLPLLGAEPDAALRGTIIHDALSRFTRAFPRELPDDCGAELMKIARAELDELTDNPRIAAFWLPRLERFAEWFAETEAARREHMIEALTEVEGKIVLGTAVPFTLTARADRIDVRADGAIITDYKTMGESSLRGLAGAAARGGAPQLPLEAAIAIGNGFAGLKTTEIAGLRYISAAGSEPAGVEIMVKPKDMSLADLAAKEQQGLERLLARFELADTAYEAMRRRGFNYDYDDYAHLARVDEWSGGGSDSGGEG